MSDPSSVTSIRSKSFDDADTDKAILEEYKRTCSIIFGKASHSQMKYLQASVELQQSLLNSCDSLLAKQTRWVEDSLLKRNGESATVISSNLKALVRGYTATVDMSITMLSILYDFTTSQIEGYKKVIDILNKSYFPPSLSENK
ncbi:MAG TPA: hypothetical protein VE130_01030 [Nitrososphaeraceae archaeon]|nr:hypothetical protein [Nitrososphaeraceae archaeon]